MKLFKTLGQLSSVGAIVPLYLGFNKMFVYHSSEYAFSLSKNAYVGGDAYNYIINANYATGYFVLTLLLLVAGIGCGVLYYLSRDYETLEVGTIEEVERKEEN